MGCHFFVGFLLVEVYEILAVGAGVGLFKENKIIWGWGLVRMEI